MTLSLNGNNVEYSKLLYLDRSLLLVNLVQSEVSVSLESIPCEPEFVKFLILYFEYGILPTPIINFRMYESLSCSFDYLACDDALLNISLDDTILNMIESSDFAINSENKKLYSLFDSNGNFVPLSMRSHEYGDFKKSNKHVLKRSPATFVIGQNRVFKCVFCSRFKFVKRIFECFGSNICVAGGSMQYLFRTTKDINDSCMMSDIDIFLINNFEHNMLSMFIIAIGEMYRNCFGDNFYVLRTAYAVTFFRTTGRHRNTIQIVLRKYESIANVLESFDLDSSCFAYDGKSFVANGRGIRSLELSANIVDVNRQSTTLEKRLLKYFYEYDIGIIIPNFQPHRVRFKQANFGMSILLESEKNLKNIIHKGYNCYGSICSSTSEGMLMENITINLRYSKFETPFILRKKNSLVFKLFSEELSTLDPVLDMTSGFIGSIGSFAPVSGPWYAEAYGGNDIPEWKTKINDARDQYNTCKVYPSRAWHIQLSETLMLNS